MRSEWISVKERLPDNYKPVWVFTRWEADSINDCGSCVTIGEYYSDHWKIDGLIWWDDITHWMPISYPERPEGA